MKIFNLKRHATNITEELEVGTVIEREHSNTLKAIKDSIDPKTSELTLTDDEVFAMIAKDHLREIPDYYTRLKKMESEAGE